MTNKIRGSVIDLPTISATIPTSTAYPEGTVVFNSAGNTPIGWIYDSATWKPFGSTYLEATTTWDPPSLSAAANTSTPVTVTGAVLGELVQASFSNSISGGLLHAYVSAPSTVTVVLQNISGSTLNLSSGSLRVRVERM